MYNTWSHGLSRVIAAAESQLYVMQPVVFVFQEVFKLFASPEISLNLDSNS